MTKFSGKALIKSKTFWFNTLFVIVSVAGLFGFSEFTPDLKVVEMVVALGAVVNIILRLITKAPITSIK